MKQLTEDQMKALNKLIGYYEEGFDYDVEYWNDGNSDDIYEYGVDAGQNYI